MKIPQKIDDRIKEAIVRITFSPGVPPGTAAGYFHKLFKSEFDWFPVENNPKNVGEGMQFTIGTPVSNFVRKDRAFRVEIQNNAITFNVVDTYPGWEKYSPGIYSVLTEFYKEMVIEKITRIGIRYINHFERVRIFEHTVVKIPIAVPNLQNGFSQQRTEFASGDFYCFVTLVDGFPTQTEENQTSFISVVDVDVVKEFSPNEKISFEALKAFIEAAHDEEKNLFFSLLTEKFTKTLNPIY